MFKNLSTKNKTLLFVTIVLILFTITLLSIIYINQKNKLEAIEYSYYENIKKSYHKILDKHTLFYQNRIKANISSKGIKEAIVSKDRDKLYSLSLGRWNALAKENKYLKVMHFHTSDGKSFLRMHKPEKYGDNIASFRPMVAKVHKEQKPLYGFETGIFNFAYRTFVPIFKDKKYIGALEFGTRPDQILTEMMYFNELKGALFIENKNLNLYKEKNSLLIGNYSLQYQSVENRLLEKLKEENYDFSSFFEISIDKRIYKVYSFNLEDFTGTQSAKAVFFYDITTIKNEFINTLIELCILLFGLISLILMVINLGFKKNIEALDNTNDELSKNKIFIDSILDNSAHAIIATNIDGKINLFNKSAEILLGYSKNEIVNKQTPIIFHKQEEMLNRAKELSHQFNKTIEPNFELFTTKTNMGLDNSDEWIYVDKNKNEFPVSIHITSLKDKDGNINGYLEMIEDISFRKVLENSITEQKDELETIFNSSKDGIAILDLDTNFLFFNNSYLAMTGFTKEELYEKSCAELSAPEDVSRAIDAIGVVLKEGHLENFEKTCIVKDGKKVIINMSIALMPDKQRLLISTKDITQMKKQENKMKNYLELIDKNIITSTTDTDGKITYVSQSFCEISGYTKDELLGKNHRIIRHPDMKDEVFEDMWLTIKENQVWEGEIKNKRKDGTHYWVASTISPIFDEDKKIGYTAIRQDITNKKYIELISITDALTNIYNRRHFNDIFPKVINTSKRKNELVCFLIMDVDHFKQYNDTYGHQMGDDVLIAIGKRLKSSLKRSDDYCFRLGGEEFGVLFKSETKENAFLYSNQLKNSLEELKIEHTGNSASKYVTASMGLVCMNATEIKDEDSIYKYADDLLYKAKDSGRNKVVSNNGVEYV